jgi:hypothetical protein
MNNDSQLWTHKSPPPREPQPGELLCEFVRSSNHAHMRCEVRFHGESYGWEAQILQRGELFYGHGAFPREQARSRGPRGNVSRS